MNGKYEKLMAKLFDMADDAEIRKNLSETQQRINDSYAACKDNLENVLDLIDEYAIREKRYAFQLGVEFTLNALGKDKESFLQGFAAAHKLWGEENG